MHFFLVPETRETVLLDREAKRRRKAGEDVWGPSEVKKSRFSAKEVIGIWVRPVSGRASICLHGADDT